MCDKHSKTIIKMLKWDRVYIVKYITKSFNKFILIFTVYMSHSETVFSVIALNASLYVQTYEHNLIINFLDINIVSLNEKIKTYRL